MTQKRPVRIRIESVCDDERIVQDVQGELYTKSAASYLRYTEPESANLGRTATTIKLTAGEIRIVRLGDVRSEQSYIPGIEVPGTYDSPLGRWDMSCYTHHTVVRLTAGDEAAEWSYDLTAAGEHVGTYHLKLTIQEDRR